MSNKVTAVDCTAAAAAAAAQARRPRHAVMYFLQREKFVQAVAPGARRVFNRLRVLGRATTRQLARRVL
jgi:hypothetical protein